MSRTHQSLQSRLGAVPLEEGLQDEGEDEATCGGPSEADAVRKPSALDEPLLQVVERRVVGHGAADRVEEALREKQLPGLRVTRVS